MLCPEHTNACVLVDGAPLLATLALATPPDGPLEGSALGWLYNPVFAVDRAGHRQRGWTSFVAGGMAVLQDRFEAHDAFEFWMCERADMAQVLMKSLGPSRCPTRLAGGAQGLVAGSVSEGIRDVGVETRNRAASGRIRPLASVLGGA